MPNDVKSNRKYIRLKYKIAWYIGAALSFLLYFSGIIPLYVYLLRGYFKKHIAIVLMYHRISDDSDEPHITVTTRNFERQIAYLKRNFNIVSLDEMVDVYMHNKQLEKDTVAITFDDGYRDNYTDAYPILKKYNVPATVFIATGCIGKGDKMSKDEIEIMQKDNITFGAHTITHKILSGLDRNDAFIEISGSKSELEEIFQKKVKYFAYPFGKRGRDFTDESIQIVKEVGYRAAFATDNGCITKESNLFALNRIGMRNFPLFVFKARVSGIFENKWQYLLRRIVRI